MTEFVRINTQGCEVGIEVLRIAPSGGRPGGLDRPLIVFLHEGLGSVSMWRDFPQAVCDALGWPGLVYSRPGYGQSTPRRVDEAWGVDFMHSQAREVLPRVLAQCGVNSSEQPIWLLGHSDGGSIALLHAATRPNQVAGLIVMAPHVFVEAVAVSAIARTKAAFELGDLRAKLARHHSDPESAFGGWFGAWMNPEFLGWQIIGELRAITCPVLAIQGEQDEYGTFEQIETIARAVPGTQILKLASCGHSPHRDQRQAVIDAIMRLVAA